MAGPGNPKTGGRARGTPNKRTDMVRGFFTECLEEAFKDPTLRRNLVKAIVDLTLDSRTFLAMVNHVAGSPPKQVDHTHRGKVTLEQIVAGTVPSDDEGDDD